MAAATTAVAAGVKTPGAGVFSNPAQVGAMIQSMYPQYQSMDATTLGQRWIDVHTPAQAAGNGGVGGLTLQGPTGTTPLTSTDVNQTQATNQNVPDLSGLNRFATPIKPPSKPLSLAAGLQALSPNTTSLTGNGNTGYMLGGNNTPYSIPQAPPKAKPKQSSGLSTFDISKVQF